MTHEVVLKRHIKRGFGKSRFQLANLVDDMTKYDMLKCINDVVEFCIKFNNIDYLYYLVYSSNGY